MVEVQINVNNLKLDERLNDYITKKVAKLDRYLDILVEAQVDLNYAETARNANDRYVAQITIMGKGVHLRAEERTDDMFASVDAVLNKLSRQIERYKGKHWRKRGDGKSMKDIPGTLALEEEDSQEQGDIIARRKRMFLTPMDELEAIEQMALLDHLNFFVFLDADTNRVNILYRRVDGKLGLIESET